MNKVHCLLLLGAKKVIIFVSLNELALIYLSHKENESVDILICGDNLCI